MKKYCIVTLAFILTSFSAKALGVFTHEAIIDAAWDNSILPLLKKRFPASTEDDIKDAHAYAYGGAVAPDMGYYPSGSERFTNLVHYVRSGDMVNALLKEASTLNELAFAVGFMSHYHADLYGHPLATNRTVPMLYPKIKRKHGDYVTYEDDELSHMRMEFGFDVLGIANGNYASQSYREYIGFKVDTAVLSRAFSSVYGLDIYEVHNNHFSRSVETFRWVVANVLPLLTRQAWATKEKAIMEKDSTATAERFNFRMRQKVYNKNFGTGYHKPGFFPTAVSYLIRVLPKIGPLAPLKFKVPGKIEEDLFAKSFDTIVKTYSKQVQQLNKTTPTLSDINFDTGLPTTGCNYKLADLTYTTLLLDWQKKGLQTMPDVIKDDILRFYKAAKQNSAEKKCLKFWDALEVLRKEK